jgi:hypothetical protein
MGCLNQIAKKTSRHKSMQQNHSLRFEILREWAEVWAQSQEIPHGISCG